MLVLVINNGSTSSRFSLINMDNNVIMASGGAENIGTHLSCYKYKNYRGYNDNIKIKIDNYNNSINMMCNYLLHPNIGVIKDFNEIDIIGHRVVHGGEKYTEAIIIDDHVLKDIDNLSSLTPLHNNNIADLIDDYRNRFLNIDNVAVFDTAFHSTIPKENFLYAIPKELYEKYKIRKYGFHGISYSYVLDRYNHITNQDNPNIVACHLGGGSSICAIKNGKSFDTTMGYTPLSGLVMVTRCGDIDPSIIPVVMKAYNLSAEEVIKLLNSKSGYFSIANDKDAKNIVERSLMGDKDATFLRNVINNDFKRHLLSMMSNIDRVDSIVMTGGIGVKNKEQREMLLSNLEFFGVKIDTEKNNLLFDAEGIISTDDSKIPIYVIPTNEELEIAKQCKKLLEKRKKYD